MILDTLETLIELAERANERERLLHADLQLTRAALAESESQRAAMETELCIMRAQLMAVHPCW